MPHSRRPVVFAALLLIALSVCLLFFRSGWNQDVTKRSSDVPVSTSPPDPRIADLSQNLRTLNQQVSALQADPIRLEQLLRERQDNLRALLRRDPQAALQHGLSLEEYRSLPEPMRLLVETPFSELGELVSFPICGSRPGGLRKRDRILQIRLHERGLDLPIEEYGILRSLTSKSSLPVTGFFFEGQAVVRDERFQGLDAEEVEAARELFAATSAHAPDHDFLTGQPIEGESVVALSGGKLYHFAHAEHLERLNGELSRLDSLPGPQAASALLWQGAPVDPETGGLDLDSLANEVQAMSSDWTETEKLVYFIRVDFSDVSGEPIAQSTLASRLNLEVSDQIREMSYGKTWITATVSSQVVRMPSPTSTYLPSNNSLLHDDAIAAFNALGTGVNLDDYDIIGVYFASIGMSSGGITYGGLAGGSRQWLQNSFSTSLVVHEFGHNYGLGHASFWDTGGASVVGAGSNEEYGDEFDIMGNGDSPAGHFHPQGKAHLNWLESDEWTDVTAAGSGSYRLHRFDEDDTDTTTVRGLRITKGTDEYYWLGHRQNYDAVNALEQGAYLIWQRPGFSRSWLLDTTPGSSEGKNDAPVALGQTYEDSTAQVLITPVAQGGEAPNEYLDVIVNLGDFSSNNAPTGSPSGPATAEVRTGVVFQAQGADIDGDALYYTWDFGPGEQLRTGTAVAYSFQTGGSKTVTLTINDAKGGVTQETHPITVTDPSSTWTQRTSNTTKDFRSICVGEDGSSVPIAVGISYGNFRSSASISYDGTTWTTSEIPETNLNLQDVTHTGTHFIAVGEDYDFGIPDWVGTIWTSSDGSSWSKAIQLTTADTGFEAVASNGVTHVAVGENGQLYYSTDPSATTWTLGNSTVDQTLRGMDFGDGTFVAVGGHWSGDEVRVATSTNGTIWTDRSSGAGVASWQNLRHVRYLNDRFVSSGWYSKLRHSTNQGQSFSSNLLDTHEAPGMAYGNGIYFAAGINRSDSDANINLYSTDGSNWTMATPTDTSTRAGAVFFNDTFLTVGTGGSIWQSDPIPAEPANWQDFQTSYFGGATQLVGFDEDFDQDGILNGIELAKGTDPTTANTPGDTLSIDGSNFPTYSVDLSATSDVGIFVEVSYDLENWTQADVVVVSSSSTQLVVRGSNSTTTHPQQFFRVNYLLAP